MYSQVALEPKNYNENFIESIMLYRASRNGVIGPNQKGQVQAPKTGRLESIQTWTICIFSPATHEGNSTKGRKRVMKIGDTTSAVVFNAMARTNDPPHTPVQETMRLW